MACSIIFTFHWLWPSGPICTFTFHWLWPDLHNNCADTFLQSANFCSFWGWTLGGLPDCPLDECNGDDDDGDDVDDDGNSDDDDNGDVYDDNVDDDKQQRAACTG